MLTVNKQSQIQDVSPYLNLETPTIDIIGSPVTALPFEVQINIILEWAMSKVSKVI